MDDATWNQVLTSLTGPEPAAAEPIEAAPEADAPLTDDATPPVDPEPTPDADPISASESAVEAAEATETAPPPIDWEHPDLKPVRERAEKLDQLERALAEQQRIRAAQQFQQTLHDLSDGDAERLQQLTGVLAQATTPLQQQAQTAMQRAEIAEKQATAFLIALRATLPDEQIAPIFEEYQALMAVEGPEVMERMAFSKRDAKQAWSAKERELQEKIKTLETRLAASHELSARGAADVVDGGTGRAAETLDRETRMRSAQTMDEYWNGLLGVNPNAA